MKIYYFGSEYRFIDDIYESGFDGSLFLYNARSADYFTTLVGNKDNLKDGFQYMVAVRPYAISPQYLSMIHRTICGMIGNRLEINLIAGDPKELEKPYNSFVGPISDSSSKIERSQYLIEYLGAIDWLKNNCFDPETEVPNIYVSTTNEFVLEAASRYGHKMIIPHVTHKKWKEDGTYKNVREKVSIDNNNILLSINPVIVFPEDGVSPDSIVPRTSDGQVFTPKQFLEEIEAFKQEGIYGLLTASWDDIRPNLFRFLKENKKFI
jgi:hypothetical protein